MISVNDSSLEHASISGSSARFAIRSILFSKRNTGLRNCRARSKARRSSLVKPALASTITASRSMPSSAWFTSAIICRPSTVVGPMDPRRVNQHHLRLGPVHNSQDAISRGLRPRSYDRDLLPHETVYER